MIHLLVDSRGPISQRQLLVLLGSLVGCSHFFTGGLAHVVKLVSFLDQALRLDFDNLPAERQRAGLLLGRVAIKSASCARGGTSRSDSSLTRGSQQFLTGLGIDCV